MACATCDSGGGGDRCGGDGSPPPSLPRPDSGEHRGKAVVSCCKCGERAAAVAAAGSGGDPTCAACLRAALLAKFKSAVTGNGLIAPAGERVLLAFSGGAASRVALSLLQEIRSDAGAGRERGLRSFGLAAVFVDERTALRLTPADAQAAVDEIAGAFAGEEGERTVPLHVVRTEVVFRDDEEEEEEEWLVDSERKLTDLFRSVGDATGREDLLEYLRMRAIQRVAVHEGFTSVVSAKCATRLAAHVIAATSKGRGFSVPADIQYMDARWRVPVILPLRDCAARDLAAFCHFSKLKTTFVKSLTTMAGPASSLNSAAHAFVDLVQDENSSREQTILRTAAKLKCFSFNEVVPPPNRRRKNPQLSKHAIDEIGLDMSCSICGAPMDSKNDSVLASDSVDAKFDKAQCIGDPLKQFVEFRSTCCLSCRFQILSEDEGKGPHTYGLLPRDLKETGTTSSARRQNWMRSQIESFLLPEEVLDGGEDG